MHAYNWAINLATDSIASDVHSKLGGMLTWGCVLHDEFIGVMDSVMQLDVALAVVEVRQNRLRQIHSVLLFFTTGRVLRVMMMAY